MSGWLIARDAVIVATPARAATSASVLRPLARPFGALFAVSFFVIVHI
jgi:hypothetical protein